MMKLYKSAHFLLTEIRTTGKKQTNGVLCFEGLPSVYGSYKEVTAVESGVVIRAGMNYDVSSREHRCGMVVTVTGRNGVTVTYGRLAKRCVNVGDRVRAGDIIGIEGSSGTGSREYLTLEFRRNGRRVDGCEYLGIRAEPCEFKPPIAEPAEVVCRVCGISDKLRTYINSTPEGQELWRKILVRLKKAD